MELLLGEGFLMKREILSLVFYIGEGGSNLILLARAIFFASPKIWGGGASNLVGGGGVQRFGGRGGRPAGTRRFLGPRRKNQGPRG